MKLNIEVKETRRQLIDIDQEDFRYAALDAVKAVYADAAKGAEIHNVKVYPAGPRVPYPVKLTGDALMEILKNHPDEAINLYDRSGEMPDVTMERRDGRYLRVLYIHQKTCEIVFANGGWIERLTGEKLLRWVQEAIITGTCYQSLLDRIEDPVNGYDPLTFDQHLKVVMGKFAPFPNAACDLEFWQVREIAEIGAFAVMHLLHRFYKRSVDALASVLPTPGFRYTVR